MSGQGISEQFRGRCRCKDEAVLAVRFSVPKPGKAREPSVWSQPCFGSRSALPWNEGMRSVETRSDGLGRGRRQGSVRSVGRAVQFQASRARLYDTAGPLSLTRARGVQRKGAGGSGTWREAGRRGFARHRFVRSSGGLRIACRRPRSCLPAAERSAAAIVASNTRAVNCPIHTEAESPSPIRNGGEVERVGVRREQRRKASTLTMGGDRPRLLRRAFEAKNGSILQRLLYSPTLYYVQQHLSKLTGRCEPLDKRNRRCVPPVRWGRRGLVDGNRDGLRDDPGPSRKTGIKSK
jgi:hypothetical protein